MEHFFSSKHRLFYYTISVLALFFAVMMCITPPGPASRRSSDAIAAERNQQAEMIQKATE